MSAHEKDGKSGPIAGVPLPTVKTVVGLPNLPEYSPLDLDMEELSGSLLLEEPSGRAAPSASRAGLPSSVSPFPPAASFAPPPSTTPVPVLPKPNPPPRHELAVASEGRPAAVDDADPPAEQPTFARVEALPPMAPAPPPEPRETRSRAASPIIALAGLLAGVASIVFVVMAIRGRIEPTHAWVNPSAQASPPASATTPQNPAPSAASALPACIVTGEPRVLAPSAMVTAGIEVRSFGDDIALGFAASGHQAMLLRLEPLSLSVVESTVARSARAVQRATPIPGTKGRLGLAIDVDRKADPMQGRRTIPLDPPVQIGAVNGQLAWGSLGRGIQGKLWPLGGDGSVEALRGARSESNLGMFAVAFRRGGAVWVGTAERSTTLTPKGDLLRIDGLGPVVGSPAIAFNEGVVILAWADRLPSDDAWRLRWTHFKAGDPSGEPSTFEPPAGGKGQEVMSPGLGVVPGGRFLLVWTEGPTSAHEVRALTLSSDGAPFGAPLRVSNAGVNAGQGQVAVTASGRGLVAFLEARSSGGFQVAATPIACGL